MGLHSLVRRIRTQRRRFSYFEDRFGVVVLSESFFEKRWPQAELSGLMARATSSDSKVILPVWHHISKEYLLAQAPILANKYATDTRWGIEKVANKLARALPGADYRTRDLLLGRWRDPFDDDTLHITDQGGERLATGKELQ